MTTRNRIDESIFHLPNPKSGKISGSEFVYGVILSYCVRVGGVAVLEVINFPVVFSKVIPAIISPDKKRAFMFKSNLRPHVRE